MNTLCCLTVKWGTQPSKRLMWSEKNVLTVTEFSSMQGDSLPALSTPYSHTSLFYDPTQAFYWARPAHIKGCVCVCGCLFTELREITVFISQSLSANPTKLRFLFLQRA